MTFRLADCGGCIEITDTALVHRMFRTGPPGTTCSIVAVRASPRRSPGEITIDNCLLTPSLSKQGDTKVRQERRTLSGKSSPPFTGQAASGGACRYWQHGR
jgi:hypothetical protein